MNCPRTGKCFSPILLLNTINNTAIFKYEEIMRNKSRGYFYSGLEGY
ncbi:hypothetical protein KsCSTR_36560 [Candidatus Kuenenia stuttgartiensis]|uniref:Uncharacterized protein n=1 Tax=Kuenenia stuttgartiensis TaxID=174633 RepID=Q1Q6G8_KUEST|nr:hypothetical protein KsCSTR_36560 [Candidatus Kuenenia stuttgartiensis]CAJ73163.1 unknown protein [Candidatus Kuenenia stuttgartiensis]